MRILSFNVQNLTPGKAPSSLAGALDRDEPDGVPDDPGATDLADRRLTAAVIAEADADVVALQEVFDQPTLDLFHDRFLLPAIGAPYPHRICLPGNDGHGLDVAVMSRPAPDEVRSHARLTAADLSIDGPPGAPIFRRDCLMVRFGRLTLWVCHFKAPYPDEETAWRTRRREASAVRRLIERSHARPQDAYWLVLGDLNDPDPDPSDRDRGRGLATEPLRGGFSVDLLERLPAPGRWTWHDRESGAHACPDALLASPALARDWPQAVPRILRMGLAREAGARSDPRLPSVGRHRPHASDHAALLVEFPGL